MEKPKVSLQIGIISAEKLGLECQPAPFEIEKKELDLFCVLCACLFGTDVRDCVKVVEGGKLQLDPERIAEFSPRVLLTGEAVSLVGTSQKKSWKNQIRAAAPGVHLTRKYTAKLTHQKKYLLQFDELAEIIILLKCGKKLGFDLFEMNVLSEVHYWDRKIEKDFFRDLAG